MTLRVLLLGLIDINPMTGYDLMKVFETSMIFYWHATHTQIYNTLKEMEKDGLVTGAVIHKEAGPSKRVFSITESGRKLMAEWLTAEPELPGFKHDFLIKLSFGSKLPKEDLAVQLDIYEKKLKDKLAALESEKKNVFMAFSRSEKESVLWEMTFENGIMYYKNELEWVGKVKARLS